MTSSNLLAAVAPGSAARLMQAFELPHADSSPALVGIVVGAIAGVVVFVTAVALVARVKRTRRMHAIASSGPVLVVPPYPIEPQRSLPPVVPSNALSARAFAKMGFAFGERIDGPAIDPFEEMALANATGASNVDETGDAIPVSVSVEHTQPLVVLKPPPAPSAADESAPNPLAVIPATSSAMIRAAAELPELDYDEDNGDTQIGEPFFDEPPKPRTMGERPRIRPIQPAGPRFASPLPAVAAPAAIPPEPPTVRRVNGVP